MWETASFCEGYHNVCEEHHNFRDWHHISVRTTMDFFFQTWYGRIAVGRRRFYSFFFLICFWIDTTFFVRSTTFFVRCTTILWGHTTIFIRETTIFVRGTIIEVANLKNKNAEICLNEPEKFYAFWNQLFVFVFLYPSVTLYFTIVYVILQLLIS